MTIKRSDGLRKIEKKEQVSRAQKSFQKSFLTFQTIEDGIVIFPTYKRLYLQINPINPSLMKKEEKESIIDELSALLATFDNVNEIALHVIDKQADVESNLELIRNLSNKSTNQYVKNYMHEQECELLAANENGTERLFFLCLTYPPHYESEKIMIEARQLVLTDSKFMLKIMTKQDIQKVFNVYCTRDFNTCPSIQEQLVLKYSDLNKGNEETIAFKNAMAPIRARFMPSHAQIGDLYTKTFVIKKYPHKANKLILLENLSKLHGVDITIRLNKIDEMKIGSGIDKTISASKQSSQTANKETEKMESRKKQEELGKMYERMLEENESMYYMSVFIQVKAFDFDEIKLLEKRVQRELKLIAFVKETPQLLQREAWYSCAPFGENQMFNLVARNVPLSTIGCMMPFVYSGRKDVKGQIIGEDNAGGKIVVDFEKKDFEVTNTNIVILGESGQGKTRLEHMIMFQKVARGNRLFIEDPEREHSSFVEKLGGTYIQPGGEYMINPLEVFDFGEVSENDDEQLYMSQTSPLRQHIGWVSDFFMAYNDQINIDLVAILLEKFYIHQGYSFTTVEYIPVKESPTLSMFYHYVEEEMKRLEKQHIEERMLFEKIEMSSALNIVQYVEKKDVYIYQKEQLSLLLQQIHGICIGSDSDLCNGQTKMVSNMIVAWDLNDLLAGSKRRLRVMQHLISGYVWNQVVKYRYYEKVTYVISELSLRLHKENMSGIISTVGMLKRFRKYEADMILSTQNPYDMLREGLREYTSSLFTSPAFRFLFYPGDGDKEEFIKVVNITETEYSKISKSKKGNVLFTAGATKYNMQIHPPTQTEQLLYGRGVGL